MNKHLNVQTIAKMFGLAIGFVIGFVTGKLVIDNLGDRNK